MSAEKQQTPQPDSQWLLLEGHKEGVANVDLAVGLFYGTMAVASVFAVRTGMMSLRGAAAFFAFPLVNVPISILSNKYEKHSFAIESARIGLGLVLAPLCAAFTDGPFAPGWPSSMLAMIGGLIMLGVSGRPLKYSYLLIAAHVFLLSLASVVFPPNPDARNPEAPALNVYELILPGASLILTGFLMTHMLSLLAKYMLKLRERSHELTVARDALLEELSVAHKIQTLLLPQEPLLPDNQVIGKMVPASEVGGDYYDVIQFEGQRTLLAVGDVSGHGLTSGLTMMMARTALLGIFEARPDISLVDAYRALNRCLRHNLARMGMDMYMTFALLESKGAGRFEAVGQHLPLLVYRKATGGIEEIELEGVWLGMVDDVGPEVLKTTGFSLLSGDVLVLYTDGVVEHFAGREMFGFTRFKDLVIANALSGPAALVDATLAQLRAFSSEQKDDITLLVVRHTGDSPRGAHPVQDVSDLSTEPLVSQVAPSP